MPNFYVITWTAYDISNFFFYTKDKDDRSAMQISGVMVEVKSIHFYSSKDKNSILAFSAFYGVIEDIFEIYYVIFKMFLFKCKWVSNNKGVQTDELGFTHVELDKKTYMIEPFIMATQATCFLCDRPC